MILTDAIFGQENALNLEPNTFIGGIASTIPDKATLASLLNISANNIPVFQIVGDNIEARVNQDYNTRSNFLWKAYGLTWWRDLDSHWKSTGGITFTNCTHLTEVIANGLILSGSQFCRVSTVLENVELNSLDILDSYCLENAPIDFLKLPSATKITNQGIGRNINKIFAPNCKFFGNDLTNNSVFANAKSGLKIYVHKDLDPSDADIADAESKGVNVIRILNTTAPNPVVNLSIGIKYATGFQCNFTPPSSVNAIDFYECYVNGVYNNDFLASGGYAIGLTPATQYNITLIAVDEFYNKSEVSNTVSDTTNTIYTIPTEKINNYYKLETNALDSIGTKNGTASGITYAGGYAIFNGSGNINLPADIYVNPTKLSFSFLIQADDVAAEYRCLTLNNNTGGLYIVVRLNSGGMINKIKFHAHDGTNQTISTSDYSVTGLLHISGSITKNGMVVLYVMGDKIGETSITNFTQISSNGNYIGAARNGTIQLKGKMRGVTFWNNVLTDIEHSEIATKQLSGQQLI